MALSLLPHAALGKLSHGHSRMQVQVNLSKVDHGLHLRGNTGSSPMVPSEVSTALVKEDASLLQDQSRLGPWETIQFFLMLSYGELVVLVLSWGALTVAFAYYYHKYKELPDVHPDSLSNEASEEFKTWKHGLFDCLQVPELCLQAFLCPSVRWADTMRMMGHFSFWTGFFIMFSIAVCDALSMGVFLHVVLAGLGAYYRQQLRKQFHMEAGVQSMVLDYMAYWCCGPCAVTQEARHVQEAEKKEHPVVLSARRE